MTIYYIKQDNTIWGCGEAGCCGEYYEEIDDIFLECDCIPESEMNADHLQGCQGGGPILKWRKATKKEAFAFSEGKDDGFSDGFESGIEYQKKKEIRNAELANKAKTDAQRTVHELVHLGYKVTIDGTKIDKPISNYSEFSEDGVLQTPYIYDGADGFSLQIKNDSDGLSFGAIRSEYFLVVGDEEVAVTPTIAYGIAKAMDHFKAKFGGK
jgi:hypothetical protein